MKIGILTFHRCINYGSYWQASCLASFLQSRGHQVEILDHHSRRVNFAEWKCALQPVLPTPVPVSDYPLYRKKIEKFFDAFELLPLSHEFSLENPISMDEYDMVVVGSDEVWNLSHPWYGHYPIFYGEGLKAGRLISYAASFGNFDSTWRLAPEWAQKLQNFDRISVRDENSQQQVKNVLGYEPEMVMDPCFLLPVRSEKINLPVSKPFLALYGHNFSEPFIRQISHWAKKQKLPLVSIGYRNHWADEQWLTAGPYEFAAFIAQSEAVITNFFHGCVFALINSKPFVCETTPYRSHKVEDLIKKADAKKHIITNETSEKELENLLLKPLDAEIHRNIAKLRMNSQNWLEKSLTPNVAVNSYENV